MHIFWAARIIHFLTDSVDKIVAKYPGVDGSH
jgi:hypothetical protein